MLDISETLGGVDFLQTIQPFSFFKRVPVMWLKQKTNRFELVFVSNINASLPLRGSLTLHFTASFLFIPNKKPALKERVDWRLSANLC